ncbi:DUF2163 domain-containing protein [Fulvimarina endophytica]|uniref:DUF2163 domain-containing protein n=1 Tax=Fulvimarina endophytica TaxID=2293836 RepID=A0A371X4V0_9HYPH|nr:DUF2163 domain-containing protein [Fulvimarina endophytica]RFC64229.1 DUF2163 domain-containing protein [Fulvimarina endophytica]
MKRFPTSLKEALAGPVTTLCECWRVSRADGMVLGFTDHDEDLVFAGTRFEARSGFGASEAESALGLSAGTREVTGALASDRIEEADIAAGRYDGARVESFLVDWTRPESAHALTDVQTVGEIRRGDLAFTVELRSRMADLDRVRGRLYRRTCDAVFGDRRCGVDLDGRGLRREAMVRAVRGRIVVLDPGDAPAAHDYAHGRVEFLTGPAAGLAFEIASAGIDPGTGLEIVPTCALPVLPEEGDRVRITKGCDKRAATCAGRFANLANFRGFPHVPGSDAVLGVAKSGDRHDGRPLAP